MVVRGGAVRRVVLFSVIVGPRRSPARSVRRVDIEEGKLGHLDVAAFREAYRDGRFANQSAVGQVLARRRHVGDVEVSREVIGDLGAGTRFGNLTKINYDNA